MPVLLKKLFRTIYTTRGQFLAIAAVVAVGITVYISMTTVSYNLNYTKEQFYQQNRFADYYFQVIKAPEGLLRQIAGVPGVMQATGRIQKDVPWLRPDGSRGTVRLTSYELPLGRQLNQLELVQGRLFEKDPSGSSIEIVVDPQFWRGNQLRPGKTIAVVAEGREIDLTVVGAATGPEFIYPLQGLGNLISDPQNFGIGMIPTSQAQQILALEGQYNQFLIRFAPGADQPRAVARIKELLRPYGDLADYPRKQQLSDAIVKQELDQLEAMAQFLPTIFLGLAALIQFVILGRMIKGQRMQIGVMKALGYTDWQVLLHYTGYALTVAAVGALFGSVAGTGLASLFSQIYAQYFNFPSPIKGINLQSLLNGFVLSLSVGGLAGVLGSRKILSIVPAESMRQEMPLKAGAVFLERWPRIWGRVSMSWRMTLRTLNRNRFRSAVVLIGVLFATGMMVVSLFTRDTMDYMLIRYFKEDLGYDYLIRLVNPVNESELLSLTGSESIVRAEPMAEIPVRLRFQGKKEEDLLMAVSPPMQLRKLRSAAGQELTVPSEGILLNQVVAKKLGAQTGDWLEVETILAIGPTHTARLRVMGINEQLIGGASFVSLGQVNRILQEQKVITGVMVKVAYGRGAAMEQAWADIPGIAAISSRDKELDYFNQNLGYMYYSIGVMLAFAVILGFAIVYNASVMSFAERRRDLASLRVMGFTRTEMARLLWQENLLPTVVGIVLGLPFGNVLSRAYASSVSSELFTFPVIIYPFTYLLAGLISFSFVAITYQLANRAIDRIDLVEVLKTRD